MKDPLGLQSADVCCELMPQDLGSHHPSKNNQLYITQSLHICLYYYGGYALNTEIIHNYYFV